MRILTGIKPTGLLHLGNYFGSIKQLLDYQQATNQAEHEIFAFIANAHALTTPLEAKMHAFYTKSLLSTYLACGIDPNKICLYLQTDISETFELAWLLTCFCTKGVLDRSHAFKAAQDNQNEAVGMGIYSYPILMAADILGVDVNIVPVGPDQKQHIEICRDLAIKINHHLESQGLQSAFVVPDIQIEMEQSITGLDGRKMSKSYDNTIKLTDTPEQIKKLIYGIKTDSSGMNEPKALDTLYELYALFATDAEKVELASKYQTGIGWAQVKATVYDKVNAFITPIREKYEYYMLQDELLEQILLQGAQKARPIIQNTLYRAKKVLVA